MTEQNIMSRVKGWFRRTSLDDGESTGMQTLIDRPARQQMEPRNSFLHPFAKRDAAMQSMQQGFVTLTELMVGIRENLEQQNGRQDQLLEHLSRLPALIEHLPDNS